MASKQDHTMSVFNLQQQQGNLMQSGLVGGIAVAVDKMYYNTPQNDPIMVFAQSAGSEYFSENLDQMLFADSGNSQVTGPVSSGLIYTGVNMATGFDRKSPMFCFLQQVGASAVGRYASPMLRPDPVPVTVTAARPQHVRTTPRTAYPYPYYHR